MVLEYTATWKIYAALNTYTHFLLLVIPNRFIANNWINSVYVRADNPWNKLLKNQLSCCWWMHPALKKMNSERSTQKESWTIIISFRSS